VRQSLRQLSNEEKTTYSKSLIHYLLNTNEYKTCTHICCYVPMLREEVNTIPIIEHSLDLNKKLYVPVMMEGDHIEMLNVPSRTDFDTFSTNSYGILEPPNDSIPSRSNILDDINANSDVLFVIPGLAFDRKNGRLGRGKGYYDRFISKLRTSQSATTHLIALCFDCQLVDDVPMESYDQYVDKVVTVSDLL
jgi:5-formyltetrahydrofolate cyclo-ligase